MDASPAHSMAHSIAMALVHRLARCVACSFIVLAAGLAPATLAQSTGGLDERVQRLERALDNRGLLDLVQQVELLNEQVRQLRGELENQVFALEQLRTSQRQSYVDVDNRLGALEQGTPSAAATLPGASLAAPALRHGGMPGDPPLPTLAAPAATGIAGAPAGEGIVVDSQSSLTAAVTPAQNPALAPLDGNGLDVNAAAAGLATAPATAAIGDGAGATVATTPAPTSALTPTAALAPSPTPSLAPTPGANSAESEAAYREAFGLLKAGQYEDSIAAFDDYLARYPGSQYADNAQYWLGEAYYVMRQFEPAIEQYQRLIQGYPASKKQSHAMLKVAYSYDELKQGDKAIAVLNDLKSRFPGSAAARLADERLQRLRAAAP